MSTQILQRQERIKLTNVIADLYDFKAGGARDRYILMDQASLQRFVPGMNLDGPARTVAGDLLSRLEKYGYLTEQPGYHALGALLVYIYDRGETPEEDTRFLASLIVKYNLIQDADYIQSLRAQHGITESSVVPSATPKFPQAIAGATPPQAPSFPALLYDASALEGIINSEDNFLDIYLLMGAIYAAQAVARIERPLGTPIGTGFLIGPDLFLTNQHVLQKAEYLEEAVARFGYMIDGSGVAGAGHVIPFKAEFYHASPKEELDYALVRMAEAPLNTITIGKQGESLSFMQLLREGKHRGYLPLVNNMISKHRRVNIIQHPEGKEMKVVLTQNYVDDDMTEARVRYVADTNEGSSGSPVFNEKWEVIALHHSGQPYPEDPHINEANKVWKRKYRVNEGIPSRAILADFKKRKLEKYLPFL